MVEISADVNTRNCGYLKEWTKSRPMTIKGSMRKNPQPLTKIGQGVKKFTAENSAAKFYPNQIAYLRGKRYETEKKIAGGDGTNQFTKEECYQNETKAKKRTSEKIADEYGVGRSTIMRNANFAKVIDILPEPVKQGILSGEQKISHADTNTILKMDKPTQKKFLEEKNGIPFFMICAVKKKPPNG